MIASGINFPDKHLQRDMVHGMSIVGNMDPTSSVAARTMPSSMNPEQLKLNLRANNKAITKHFPTT